MNSGTLGNSGRECKNFDGSVVTIGDGAAESGISGAEWVSRMEWVAPPASSCSLDPSFGVGIVGE